MVRWANKLALYNLEGSVCTVLAIVKVIAKQILLLQAEVETHIFTADGKFKFKIDINRHGPCAADFSLLNLPKGKSLGRSKPATNS
jgi:hypothetical protein